jgi:hypothetical protein
MGESFTWVRKDGGTLPTTFCAIAKLFLGEGGEGASRTGIATGHWGILARGLERTVERQDDNRRHGSTGHEIGFG